MIFVDTGAFLARYLRRDQFHERAVGLWKKLETRRTRLLTTSFVIDETTTLLTRWADASFAVARAREMYGSRVLSVVRPDEEVELEALEWLEKYGDHRPSFTDCVSFAVMRRARLRTAFSFDDDFRLAGYRRAG